MVAVAILIVLEDGTGSSPPGTPVTATISTSTIRSMYENADQRKASCRLPTVERRVIFRCTLTRVTGLPFHPQIQH